jgi:hypothetical protein
MAARAGIPDIGDQLGLGRLARWAINLVRAMDVPVADKHAWIACRRRSTGQRGRQPRDLEPPSDVLDLAGESAEVDHAATLAAEQAADSACRICTVTRQLVQI